MEAQANTSVDLALPVAHTACFPALQLSAIVAAHEA
jgi:hypothetical protein